MPYQAELPQKVMVDYLTPKQTAAAIVDHYANNAKKEFVSAELLDINNPKLNQICEIISDKTKGHEMEYRKLFNNIIPDTLIDSPEAKTIELKNFVQAVTNPSTARELRLTESEINELKRIAA